MNLQACGLFAFLLLGYASSAQMNRQAMDSIRKLSEQDHQAMMKLLRVDAMRPGPSGNPQAADAANIDEAKASPYTTLPDPLVLNNGKPVTSAKIWWQQRRPEIVEDFDREVYGRTPKNLPKVTWEIVSTSDTTLGTVKAISKRLVGHVDNSLYPAIKVDIQLSLLTPAQATGPVPVMLEFGFIFPAGFRAPATQTNASS